jgi:hypothetical protein
MIYIELGHPGLPATNVVVDRPHHDPTVLKQKNQLIKFPARVAMLMHRYKLNDKGLRFAVWLVVEMSGKVTTRCKRRFDHSHEQCNDLTAISRYFYSYPKDGRHVY